MKSSVKAQLSSRITSDDLLTIVANASFLWERLDTEKFDIAENQVNTEAENLLNRWCYIAGKQEKLEKRLQWDGLDLKTIHSYLGAAKLKANQPLPEWAETLQQIMQMAIESPSEPEIPLPIDSTNPIPFEDLLLPAIKVARYKLLVKLNSWQLEDSSPFSLVSEKAYLSLERSLLRQLGGICAKTLNFEFSQVRPFGQNLLTILSLEIEDSISTEYYKKFVDQLLKSGLLPLFYKYPVLGRLVATAVNFWVEAIAEFLQRLEEDRIEVLRKFGSVTDSPVKVTEIKAFLSDPHKAGRTVIALTFESGLKLIYKPRDVGLEVAYNQFLGWCNQHSKLLDFKVTQVLNRGNYGWMEYVEHQPCMDDAAAKRFYLRAGMLLCVLYALRGTDCHHENLIASGEHLVLIDMEALLHPEAKLLEDSLAAQKLETTALKQLWNSVLRTGLLPHWDLSSDRRTAYDISGLGSTNAQQSPWKVPCWKFINTDNMCLQYEFGTLPPKKNLPYLDGRNLSANNYQAEITAGFEQMYRFLMVHKQELLAADSPFVALQNQPVRFIFRATRVYSTLLQKILVPDYLKHGVAYSVELEHLSVAFLMAQQRPEAWSILSTELRAMEQMDVPYFCSTANSEDLRIADKLSIPSYFRNPGYQYALAQLQSMDETDLARQVAIIQGTFYAKSAQTSIESNAGWNSESLPVLSREQLIGEAEAIATDLENRAIPDPDGSLNWLGLGFVPEVERFQLQVLNHSLYDGTCGVALFLAALSKVQGAEKFRALTLKTLQSLRWQIHHLDPDSRRLIPQFKSIGGSAGLGSMVYTFVKVAHLLNDVNLLEDAKTLADWITPHLIDADQELDVISGAAGAILGLLALYDVSKDEKTLAQAIACGQKLLIHRVSHESSPKAWIGANDRPLTGFSHGAAGISYTLLRLYAVTADQNYLDAAIEGMEYERYAFSQVQANWPDFRTRGQVNFPNQWCHGAAGIGLARLGSLKILQTPAIEQEIKIALQTTQKVGLQAIDQLCCGNMGRAEVLLVGAQLCSRPDWHQAALQNATNVVARAQKTGFYQLFVNLPSSVFSPGFFRGTAGIGYQLLRLAAPEDIPSVLLWQ